MLWWAESAPLGWDRVKVSENLDATAVAPCGYIPAWYEETLIIHFYQYELSKENTYLFMYVYINYSTNAFVL